MRPLLLAHIVIAAAIPAAADTVRLDADRAVELALESSSRLAAADARIDAADARVESADAEQRPVVSALGSVAYRSAVDELMAPLDPGGSPIVLFPNIQETASVGLRLEQPLYLGGAIDASRRAVRDDRSGIEADRSALRADIELEARTAYWSTVAARAAVDAARADVERAARLAADVAALRDAGMAVHAEVLAADARVAAARLRRVDAQADSADAEARLRSLLGRPAGDELELSDRGSAPPPPPPAELLQEEALHHRPELVALAARIDSVEERQEAARAGSRPRVSGVAGWDLARPNQRHLPLRDEWDDSWSVGVNASWTLFDGHRTGARVAELEAQRSALESELAELERRVRLDVELARTRLASVLEAARAAEASRRAAAAREEAERDRLSAGMATVSDLLDAQSELAAAEQELVATRARARIAAAALVRAVGR